jgi:hypothetical protein
MKFCNFDTAQEIITKKLASYVKRGFSTWWGSGEEED